MRDIEDPKRTIFAYYADLEDAQAELEIMKKETQDANEQQQKQKQKQHQDAAGPYEPGTFPVASFSDQQEQSSTTSPPARTSGLDALHNLILCGCGGAMDANKEIEDENSLTQQINSGLVPPSPPASPPRNYNRLSLNLSLNHLSQPNKKGAGEKEEEEEVHRLLPQRSIESELQVDELADPIRLDRKQFETRQLDISTLKRAGSTDERQYITSTRKRAGSTDDRSTHSRSSIELFLRPLEHRSRASPRPPLSPTAPSASKETRRGATTQLHRIARAGEWQKLRDVLTATAASDYGITVSSAGQPDEKGRTPLMLACRHGSSFPPDVARLLLVANANAASKAVVQSHGGEQTCLHIATTAGCSLEVLDILLAGAPSSVYMADDNGNMPLHLAVNNGIYRCAEVIATGEAVGVLLENMPPQDVVVQKKRPATGAGDADNVFDMISAASSCESSVGGSGASSTSLGSVNAGFETHTDLVDACELLILAHPDALRHRNRRGETPLLLAMYRRASADVISLLLRKGGAEAVQIPDNFGSYPLHFCDRAPSLKIIRDMARLYPEGTMSFNELQETPLYSAMLDNCDAAVLRVLLDACPEPKMAVNHHNIRGESVIKFGWDALLTPRIVAAEDQDEEDARIEDGKRLLHSASSIVDLHGTAVSKWWEKTSLLLQASYHNSTALDEKTGIIGARVWSPCHAAAGIVCPTKMLQFILQIHPHQATSQDEYGNTPYHIVALRATEISKDALYSVINAGPDAALIQNKDGNTPLHLAILFGAPPEMLQIMLAIGAKAACIKNNAGLTPLFTALAIGTPITTLRMILKACPESVQVRDNDGTSSIQFAWTLLITGMIADNSNEGNGEEQKQRSFSNINTLALSARSSSLVGDARVWMGKIDLLLRTAFHGVAENRSIPHKRRWRAVHAACNGGPCPFDVLAFSLQILPTEINVVNEDGNLPLHIAASAPPYEVNTPSELAPGRPIHLLLNRFSDGAMKFNRNGRLPLHLALESGKTMGNGIEALIDSFPESVRMRDPETMLFPFMLAAAKREGNDTETSVQDKENADLASVNTVFVLLLEAPELARKRRSNAELHYTRRRNIELLDEVEDLKQQKAEMEAELQMRMTRLEIKETEDIKKMEENRRKEEECRSRALYLEQSSNEVSGKLSSLAHSLFDMKEHTSKYNR